MTILSTKWLGLAALSLALAAPMATAQTPEVTQDDGASDKILDTIRVTGQHLYSSKINALKSPTPILDVPQSLSIITADQIAKRGFDSIGDIVDYTAGVNLSQGEGHRDAVVFRGVRSTADFFIDGVRDDVQYYRPLYNLEQVEILRGPNALLFGRGGTGGIINRVAKKGVMDDSFTAYGFGVDSLGGYNLEFDGNHAVSDTAALRLNALYEDLASDRDFFDGTRIGLNPTIAIELAPTTTLDLSYEYADHERFIDRGIPTGADGKPVEAFKDIVFADAVLNTSALTAHIFRANLQTQFTDTIKGNFNVFYGNYDKFYRNFYAANYDAATSPNVVTLDGYEDTTARKNASLSGNLIGEFDTKGIHHTVVIGGELTYTASDQDRQNAVFSTSGNDRERFAIGRPLAFADGFGLLADGVTPTQVNFSDLNDDTRVDINVFSGYIQDEIALSEMFHIVLGARFDSFDINVDNIKANETRARTDSAISPRFGLIFKPRDTISAYASYSESFLPRSGEQFANINGDASDLDPDVFENAEIGVKWDITPALSFTSAAFQNTQTRAEKDNTTGEAFEVRGLEISGLELQLDGEVTDKFYLRAGYSYLQGETADGVAPRELPENTLSLWGAYQLTDRFGFGLGATSQSETLISDGGSQTLPSYTRVDAAAYYDWSDQFRLQLNIENLTDETYFPSAHSTHQVTVGNPMTFDISARVKF